MKYTRNIAKDFAESDQFICEQCGLHLQDWVRYDVEEWWDEDCIEGTIHRDVHCYEYVFKYCPNCGAKVIEEE